MKKIKNNSLRILFLFFVCFFFVVKPVDAHIGGGPPILKIDGRDAATNPFFHQEVTTINLPQDIPPDTYLKNKPIQFVLDVESLVLQTTFPPDLANEISFRWSVATGENFDQVNKDYKYGANVTYTFTEAKSYLVIIEAKTPIDDDYIVIDSMQINVVPDVSYQLPTTSVSIGIQGTNSDRPVLLVSQASVDGTAKVRSSLWDFNEGKLVQGDHVERSFTVSNPYNTRIIYHRIVDSNGFIADVAFAAENYQDKIQFMPFGNLKYPPFQIETYSQAKSRIAGGLQVPVVVIIWGIVMAIGILIIVIFSVEIIRKTRKRRK